MTEDTTDTAKTESRIRWTLRILKAMWRDFVSVYYANTLVWRGLKSGALIFLGLFCWIGANLTLSYVTWGFLRYVMAYGFALLFWGPFTHLVVVPLIIRLRRTGRHPVTRAFTRHGSKLNLTVFVAVVIVLGMVMPGVMTFEFQVSTGGAGPDVSGDLECTKTAEVVDCRVVNPEGIDSVVVFSEGERLTSVEDPPFEFQLRVEDIQRVNDQRQFTVELRDEDGQTLRRFVRQVELIPTG